MIGAAGQMTWTVCITLPSCTWSVVLAWPRGSKAMVATFPSVSPPMCTISKMSEVALMAIFCRIYKICRPITRPPTARARPAGWSWIHC